MPLRHPSAPLDSTWKHRDRLWRWHKACRKCLVVQRDRSDIVDQAFRAAQTALSSSGHMQMTARRLDLVYQRSLDDGQGLRPKNAELDPDRPVHHFMLNCVAGIGAGRILIAAAPARPAPVPGSNPRRVGSMRCASSPSTCWPSQQPRGRPLRFLALRASAASSAKRFSDAAGFTPSTESSWTTITCPLGHLQHPADCRAHAPWTKARPR